MSGCGVDGLGIVGTLLKTIKLKSTYMKEVPPMRDVNVLSCCQRVAPVASRAMCLVTLALGATMQLGAAAMAVSPLVDAPPPGRAEVEAEVIRARAAVPAFQLRARVRTTVLNGGPMQERIEDVKVQPRVAFAISRCVEAGDTQCVASDGFEELRYFTASSTSGADAGGAVSGGGLRGSAGARALSALRSAADIFMAWPIAAEVCSSANDALPAHALTAHGLEAWLAQAAIEVDDEWHLVGGSPCVRLTMPPAAGSAQLVHYFLDPAAGWMPRRYEARVGDSIIVEREVLEFGWFGSGLCLPVRAVEHAGVAGRTVEFELLTDVDGSHAAGPLSESIDLLRAPDGVDCTRDE
jgi:hypothetical protein